MPSDINSWARTIKDYSEIPEMFKSYYDKNFKDSTRFLNAVYAPADSWGRRKTNDKLMFLYENNVVFLEKMKNNINAVSYPIENINYIENGSILLYSWLKINGNIEGETRSFVLEYNTVVENIFKPIIEKLRILLCDIETYDKEKEIDDFDCLRDINYKFMNYAKKAVLNGEKVIDFLYQADIKVPYFKFFKKLKSTSHMIIFTNKELIILEEENVKSTKDAKYGGIWIYIPVYKILSAYIDEAETGFLNLSINVYGANAFKSVFESSKKENVQRLAEQINKIARYNLLS
ncbi:hypothetical protein V7D15_03805 [Thermoanaerobacter thermohydrosulfuricus]|uniref:Uncharacterized protein n=1 Tax=Thermoanaerobacter thermohydrosulfuricus WC1 TaxID=1198630 RepID=M8DNU2_THETY|nr:MULTISPECIES: hypothetical protein [Thermoanaerobacter]EMT38231.1 hypothetical protein TthWC1_2263 [Thermoanaerobacter thermohydrosulfuricus WC1]